MSGFRIYLIICRRIDTYPSKKEMCTIFGKRSFTRNVDDFGNGIRDEIRRGISLLSKYGIRLWVRSQSSRVFYKFTGSTVSRISPRMMEYHRPVNTYIHTYAHIRMPEPNGTREGGTTNNGRNKDKNMRAFRTLRDLLNCRVFLVGCDSDWTKNLRYPITSHVMLHQKHSTSYNCWISPEFTQWQRSKSVVASVIKNFRISDQSRVTRNAARYLKNDKIKCKCIKNTSPNLNIVSCHTLYTLTLSIWLVNYYTCETERKVK